jgi:hypothetical protein
LDLALRFETTLRLVFDDILIGALVEVTCINLARLVRILVACVAYWVLNIVKDGHWSLIFFSDWWKDVHKPISNIFAEGTHTPFHGPWPIHIKLAACKGLNC